MKKFNKFLLATMALMAVFFVTATKVSAAKTFAYDYKSYQAKSAKTYKVDVSDNNWAGVNLKIDKVQVVKLTKKYKVKDGSSEIEANGFIRVHYAINTGDKDVSIFATLGKYSFNDGEEHESDDMQTWDGDISAHVNKAGWVSIPVEKVDDIKSVRAKIDASYETDNDDDDNQFHDYDLNVEFKK